MTVRPTADADQRDFFLWDFDVNDHRLKPEHEKALLGLLRFMAEDFRRRTGGRWTISLAGLASRTGSGALNDRLSASRAACAERFLRLHLFDFVVATDQLEFSRRVDFNACFEGFRGSPPGEKDEFRAVRVSVHRPGKTPPPVDVFPACRFIPSAHGFKFDNSFALPPAILRPLSSPPISTILSRLGIRVGAGAFGLCGGMVTLARDHFRFGVPIPPTTAAPAMFSPLFNKLVDRQLDSLNLNVASLGPNFGAPVILFARWMALPDRGRGSVAERTLAQFRGVKAALARGELRVLGLVLVSSGAGSLTDNHQVLARCLTQLGPNQFAIHIYDPNFHDCNDITIEVTVTTSEAHCNEVVPRCPSGGPARSPVRGFFVMPYRPVRP